MKRLFILLFITSFSYTLSAQNLSVPKYGIKVGVNHSSLNLTQYNYLFGGFVKPANGYAKPIVTSNTGIKGGFFVDIKLTKRWYISPTLSYSQFGAIVELERTWNSDTIRTYGNQVETYKMDYVTLDPNFEYRVNDVFSLVIGPSVGYLISNNVDKVVTEEGIERTQDALNGEIEEVSEIDAGLNLGTSFFITENFDIDCKLYIGMMGLESREDGYNKALQSASISFGYTF